MKSKEIILLLSKQRFSTYEKLFDQIAFNKNTSNEELKVQFYLDMQVIYAHFFVPMQALEVILRNRIHDSQSDYYKADFWFNKLLNESFCTEKTKAMFKSTDYFTKKNLKEKGVSTRNIRPEEYIGRFTFGFWVELLNAEYRKEKFWQYHATDVFPHKEKVKLSAVHNMLKKTQTTRNRLYHYEPLWNTLVQFSCIEDFCDTLFEQYNTIYTLIGYCSLEKERLLNDLKIRFELEVEGFKAKYGT